MGNRLSKIYTRTGDDGSTGLGDGTRVDKDSLRVEAMGAVDELNTTIGMLLCHNLPDTSQSALTNIQHSLFDIGGEICIPGSAVITADRVDTLEQLLDSLNADLAPLKEFILPGGSPAAAACHQARAVCRRAERRTHSLAKAENINPVSIKYLNRLSDLLFVMARHINKTAGMPDVFWKHDRSK
ncbi:MAG: cob(I)yrinic acid a,c-diamide adenosyltransferase [Gammaproteobacteria bacterium]|jgi:cob(I)alamin adenosyltransferase|nr:cob(I)yrinic acid a,c-diamide adenosyltransferase [Gammaproteobacteria bacterium]